MGGKRDRIFVVWNCLLLFSWSRVPAARVTVPRNKKHEWGLTGETA